MDQITQLNRHLRAAKHTGRKLKIDQIGEVFRAIFWKSAGDGVETWIGEDTDLLRAIDKAGNEYAVAMLADHLRQQGGISMQCADCKRPLKKAEIEGYSNQICLSAARREKSRPKLICNSCTERIRQSIRKFAESVQENWQRRSA